jgi:acetylserotonin O-methyltransferase
MRNQADPAPILDLIEAFRRSKTMFTAVQLGIFDELEGKPETAEALAVKLNLNAGALARLLDACVGLGLLDRNHQTYTNTPRASKYLVSASPDTLTGYIVYSDQSLYHLWAHLDDAVREGSNRWQQTFGSRDALFDYYFRDPAATADFMNAMNGFGRLSSPLVVRGFDLSRFSHLVDVGGATGHLAIAACEAYPNLHATVFDLPRIEPYARAYISNSKVADRIQFVAGDFFTDPLPCGDLYALGRILHDWSDSKIADLLRKISPMVTPGGGILVAEALLNDDRSGPVYALMQDLNMLVCTDGRERTFAGYRALLEAWGFTDVRSHRTGSVLDPVLGIKR